MLHLGMLQPYLQAIDKAGKACQGQTLRLTLLNVLLLIGNQLSAILLGVFICQSLTKCHTTICSTLKCKTWIKRLLENAVAYFAEVLLMENAF